MIMRYIKGTRKICANITQLLSNNLIKYFEWTEVQSGDCLLGLLLEPGFHDS